MAEKVKVWFDPEGDFLEVRFSDAPDSDLEHPDSNGALFGIASSDLKTSAAGPSRNFTDMYPMRADFESKVGAKFSAMIEGIAGKID